MTSFFSIDELIPEEGKTGSDWIYAKIHNSGIPTPKCRMKQAQKEARHLSFMLRSEINRQQKGVSQREALFKKFIRENKDMDAIESSARSLRVARFTLKTTRRHADDVEKLQAEIRLAIINSSEQEIMRLLTRAYRSMNRTAQYAGFPQMCIRFEKERDIAMNRKEEMHEAWDEDYGSEDQVVTDVSDMILDETCKSNIPMPSDPIWKKVKTEKEPKKQPDGSAEKDKALISRFLNL
jgi:hypothetical protein